MRSILILVIFAAALKPAVAEEAGTPVAQPVSFAAADNYFPLHADYYAPPTAVDSAPMVILLHMYRHDRTSWKPLIPALHAAGFATLALDLRGHGEEAKPETRRRVERRQTAVFEEMTNDVWGAYLWLKDQPRVDPSRFALVGASIGCSVALQYAALDPTVDAVVCLTPGEKYLGVNSNADMLKLKGRDVLMLATEDEQEAAKKLSKLGEGADTKIYPGAAHGTRMFGVVPTVETDIASFLERKLGKPTKNHVFASFRSSGRVYHFEDSEWIERISPRNLRVFSSPAEAKSRGWRASKTKAPYSDDRRGRNR